MKTIIAGSRNCSLTDVFDGVKYVEFNTTLKRMTELVSGCAKGADAFGEQIAKANNIPIKQFPAEWNNLDADNCIIKYKRCKPYNALAGFNRNEEMAKYADQLIAIWDGKSSGTKDMIERAKKHNLQIVVWDYINKKEIV